MYVYFLKRVIDFLVALALLPFLCVIYIVLAPFYFFMDMRAYVLFMQTFGQVW